MYQKCAESALIYYPLYNTTLLPKQTAEHEGDVWAESDLQLVGEIVIFFYVTAFYVAKDSFIQAARHVFQTDAACVCVCEQMSWNNASPTEAQAFFAQSITRSPKHLLKEDSQTQIPTFKLSKKGGRDERRRCYNKCHEQPLGTQQQTGASRC